MCDKAQLIKNLAIAYGLSAYFHDGDWHINVPRTVAHYKIGIAIDRGLDAIPGLDIRRVAGKHVYHYSIFIKN